MRNLMNAQTNMGNTDRIIRGLLGGVLLLHSNNKTTSDKVWNTAEKYMGGLMFGSALLGFDPLLSFWGTTTLPGKPNNLFHMLAQMLPGQNTRPASVEQPIPAKRPIQFEISPKTTVADLLSIG